MQSSIRESVDSLCRDGADRTRPFSKIEWLRTPKRGSYKPFWTHTRTLRVILYPLRPSKYVKYTATMTYRSCHTPLFGFFCSSSSSSSSSSSVELAYHKSGTSTVLGFYMKRLLSLACVILDQENLRNFTQGSVIANFPYLLEAISIWSRASRFIERWGSSARRSAGVEAGGARAKTSK